MLRDVSKVDMRTSILGQEVSFPVCVGATAMQKMAHGDGELATVRGWFTHYTYTSGHQSMETYVKPQPLPSQIPV